MELFNLKNDKIEEVELKPFKLEREIQSLIEKNTEILFNLEFIASELRVDKYRLDSLCYDNETNSFVIIEYKKGDSYSVIDQGYTYLQLLLNNKSDFILKLSQHYNKVMQISDVDFSQSKIIFVSQSFNSYQKDSVNFKNLPFELWEIKRFSNNSIVFNKHKSNSIESIDSLATSQNQTKIKSVNEEIIVYEEDYHTKKLDAKTLIKWNDLKEKLLELENINLEFQKGYIKFAGERKGICYCGFRKNKIVIELLRGNINTDGSRSKNYFNLDDPKGIAEEKLWEWKNGVKGTIYKIPLNQTSNIDYIYFLILQKYKSLLK